MGLRLAILLLAVAASALPLHAQYQAPSEHLNLAARNATTWKEGESSVIQLDGSASITLDRAKLSADHAVAWITPVSAQNLGLQDVQIVLLGNAKIEQPSATRTGEQLFVRAQLRGSNMLITAEQKAARDLSNSQVYNQAVGLRVEQGTTTQESATAPATAPAANAQKIAGPPTRQGRPAGSTEPVQFSASNIETIDTPEGTVAGVLTGGVELIQRRANGDYIELRADRVVVFTTLKSLKELANPTEKKEPLNPADKKRLSDRVVAAYLEGDVRIDYVPNRKGVGEQRLMADRVYYEFHTDRAVLTNAIVHTIEPQHQMPMIARAKLMRQLSIGEYRAEHMQLTTSSFALPSYSLAADRMYVREEPSDSPAAGPRVLYDGQGVTFQFWNIPFFWLPGASGSLEKGEPLRSIGVGQAHSFGYEAMTEWGLFETLGMVPPRDLDIAYRADYFSERGPGFGLSGAYGGGFLTDTTKKPWDFTGDFHSYLVYDHGADDVGRLPVRVHAGEDFRGEGLWEHQHFFPDNWMAQVRAGWVSDSTFLESWFRRDFEQGQEHNISVYLRHQDQTESFVLDTEWQPNKLVTTSNMQQEQFEVERLPEVQYHRIGDGFLNDNLVFFSDDSAAGMRFQPSRSPLRAQGFSLPSISPGLAALGTTGVNRNITWRGDLRQEVDWPFSAGPIRAVPYVFGRYTQYSNSPTTSEVARVFAGAGARFTTQIWKTDPTVYSDLLDIHQLRHVIEPELNFFTSASNVDNTRVFIYDEPVDKINDISAAQIALHQRWQTKRGGPGEWRSVDVFNFNVDVDFFANKPPRAVRNPYNFRGIYFPSLPEASIPRDALNADGSWRISDNTLVLADTSYNLDKMDVQTIAVGVLFRRGDRLSTYIGNRYISDLNSNITTISSNYELTTKYTLNFDQEFDFTQGHNVFSSIGLLRKFDTFYIAGRYFFDEVTGENGFSFNLYPIGLGQGLDTGSFQTFRR